MHQYHFDLSKALAAWRRSLMHNRAFTVDDLDELEQHLRDQVAGLMNQGLSEEAAFSQALREMGDYGTAESEYRKVYWGKRLHRGEVRHEFNWRFSMLKNYIKIAFRNLRRQKGYSLLNITGLAAGLACAFLIVLWIRDEVSYDRFHEGSDQLYRVMRHVYSGDEINTSDGVTLNLAEALRDGYPEVEQVAVTTLPVNLIIEQEGEPLHRWGIYASPDFFTMFSWGLMQGDPETVLQEPGGIAISASFAESVFGSDWRTEALGKTIHDAAYGIEFKVTGVYEDVPDHSSLAFSFVLPFEMYQRRNDWLTNWNNSGIRIFVRLHEGADEEDLNPKIVDLQNDHIDGFRSDIFLQAYANQHLYGTFKNGVLAGGRIDYVRIFGVVACMILLIACINFMNLATARSLRRAREIGVRKAIGAERRSLVVQFMGESALLVGIGCVMAIGLVAMALPAFNTLTGKAIALTDYGGEMLLLFAGIGLVTVLLAGSYPALYLSSFDAVRILRGTFRQGGGSTRLRQGLVVFQFAMSMVLIVGTLTLYRQIDYIYSKNLGLDRENVIYMAMSESMQEQFDAAKEALLRHADITSVTAANDSPLQIGSNTHSVEWRGKDSGAQISMHILAVGFDFLEVMGMHLTEGRNFDPAFGRDSVNYIINETARRVMGFDDPIGEQLSFWGDTGTIVGVVEDFHMASLYNPIEPTILRLRPQQTDWLFARTAPGHTDEALASLQAVHAQFMPGFPFAPIFLDETFRETYHSESVIGKLAGFFTAFALFIACLGLFGLAAFAAAQRTKEIGVRKVLGAGVPSLVALLSTDFLKLVGLAFVMAVPLAYFAMQQWLDGFAYRVEVGPFVFVLTGGLVVLIALLTVSYQSIKAALADPVKSLRHE